MFTSSGARKRKRPVTTRFRHEKGFLLDCVQTDRKKTYSITLLARDHVRLRVPYGLSKGEIDQILERALPWIEKKRALYASRPMPEPKTYEEGEEFLYLGQGYCLEFDDTVEAQEVRLSGASLKLALPKDLSLPEEKKAHIRQALLVWYQKRAEEVLTKTTHQYEPLLGVRARSLKVRDYKARWGSCSARGDISYNWRLIMAPHRVIEYVVVHELCHILEHNHSKAYWQHVESILPDFRTDKTWLKMQGASLVV